MGYLEDCGGGTAFRGLGDSGSHLTEKPTSAWASAHEHCVVWMESPLLQQLLAIESNLWGGALGEFPESHQPPGSLGFSRFFGVS